MPTDVIVGQAETSPDGSISLTLNINLNPDKPFDWAAQEGHDETTNFGNEVEPNHVMTFVYDGQVREVQNPQFTAGKVSHFRRNVLLSGLELTRDGERTEQFKHFSLDKISPLS